MPVPLIDNRTTWAIGAVTAIDIVAATGPSRAGWKVTETVRLPSGGISAHTADQRNGPPDGEASIRIVTGSSDEGFTILASFLVELPRCTWPSDSDSGGSTRISRAPRSPSSSRRHHNGRRGSQLD